MKKGCLIAAGIGLVLLLVLCAVIFLIFRLTAPLATEGDRFLAALGSGSTEAAYGMASATLRAGQSQEEFARNVKSFGLDGFQSAKWSSRNIRNDRGTLEGTARTKSGGSVPLTLELVKEGGTWKVLSIKGPQTGATTAPIIEETPKTTKTGGGEKGKLPSASDAAKLAQTSLLAFNEAIQKKSFETFHTGISKMWQKQITAAELLDAFQGFIDAKIDLADIKTLSPVFEPDPAIDSEGVLALAGHYKASPNKINFTLKYITEDGAWKLIGVNVNVKPEATLEAPTAEEAGKLAQTALAAFRAAIDGKSFDAFHAGIAKLWQEQITAAELLAAFQGFIDEKVDLAPSKPDAPELQGTPALDEDGVLVLEGSYPTASNKVVFRLKYVAEGGTWKLLGVKVNLE